MPAIEPARKPLSLEDEADIMAFRRQVFANLQRDHLRDGCGEMVIALGAITLSLTVMHWGTDILNYSGMIFALLGALFVAHFLFIWAWKHYLTIPRLGWVRFATPEFRDRPVWQRPFLIYRASCDLFMPVKPRPYWARVLLGLLKFLASVAMLVALQVAYDLFAPLLYTGKPLDFENRQFLFEMVVIMGVMPVLPLMGRCAPPTSLRTYLSAAVGLGLYLAVDLVTQTPAWAFIAVGSAFLILAVLKLRRFLRDYPRLETADAE